MNLRIGPLTQADLDPADRVFRMAFGTRNGLPDPMQFDGDAARTKARCSSPHVLALGAWDSDTLVGTSIATIWGTFGWIGPLSVLPDYWNKGIGRRLLEPTIEGIEDRNARHLALFTLGESPKHVSLYHGFGFWPGYLILIAQKTMLQRNGAGYRTYSSSTAVEKGDYLNSCRTITSSIYAGLDLSTEISELHRQDLGDTVLVIEQGRLEAFAICHIGAGSEAGSGAMQVKFAAVRPGPAAETGFEKLLDACEDLAAGKGAKRLTAGINTARRPVYSAMVERRFRSIQQGVAMHRPDEPAYDRPDAYVIDDWR